MRWGALIWVLSAAMAVAQPVEQRMAEVFEDWSVAYKAPGVLSASVLRDGAWSAPRGADASELASLSKMITALCALALVEEGRLTWSDTAQDILGAGPPVTAAQLVTHSSGLTRDATQIAMAFWLDQSGPHRSAQLRETILARGPAQGTPGTYAYNNENYALLALMIEAAGQGTYVDICWQRLGLGPAIRPSSRTGAFAPWGGLVATPEAYEQVLQRFFGPEGAVGSDPFAHPHVAMGGEAYYGLGMVFRRFGSGFNFWHFGAICLPERLEVGSFAALWDGRASAVALYDACVDWDAMVALDGALAEAALGQGQ